MQGIYDYDEHLSSIDDNFVIHGKLGNVEFDLANRDIILKAIKKQKRKSAIYLLINKTTSTVYVGRSGDIYARLIDHRHHKESFSYAIIIYSDAISTADPLERFEFNMIEHMKNLLNDDYHWRGYTLKNIQDPTPPTKFLVTEEQCFTYIKYLLAKIPHLEHRVLQTKETSKVRKSAKPIISVNSHTKLYTCPHCRAKQNQKPISNWHMSNALVSHFECSSCGKKFNHFRAKNGNEWTIPKPK